MSFVHSHQLAETLLPPQRTLGSDREEAIVAQLVSGQATRLQVGKDSEQKFEIVVNPQPAEQPGASNDQESLQMSMGSVNTQSLPAQHQARKVSQPNGTEKIDLTIIEAEAFGGTALTAARAPYVQQQPSVLECNLLPTGEQK